MLFGKVGLEPAGEAGMEEEAGYMGPSTQKDSTETKTLSGPNKQNHKKKTPLLPKRPQERMTLGDSVSALLSPELSWSVFSG